MIDIRWLIQFAIFNSELGTRIRKIQIFDEKILKADLFRQGQVFDTLDLLLKVFSQIGVDQHHGTTGLGGVSGKTDFAGQLFRNQRFDRQRAMETLIDELLRGRGEASSETLQ